MFLIFFILTQIANSHSSSQFAVGLVGGFLMVLMGIQTFRNRNKIQEDKATQSNRDSMLRRNLHNRG